MPKNSLLARSSHPKLESVVKEIKEVSTLPAISQEIIRVAGDPEAGAEDLLGVVEKDPSLSARVLRTVNSSYYGLTIEIENLQQALSYIGFNQVRNLAMTTSVRCLFDTAHEVGKYSRVGLWKHMVGVALGARLVAKHLRLQNFEDAYLAGLLHDFGLILIDQHLPMEFEKVLKLWDPGKDYLETERVILGFNHCELGVALGTVWNFSNTVKATMLHHHTSASFDGPCRTIVQTVQVADFLCNALNLTELGEKIENPPMEVFRILLLAKEDLKVLVTELQEEVEASAELFQLQE